MHLNSIVGIPFESTHARHMLPMPDHGSERPEQQRRARLFTIRAADSAGQRSSASILVNRMYAWRGYKNAELPKDGGDRITLVATDHDTTIGTIMIGFDGPEGLLVDDLFSDRANEFRGQGVMLCEFIKLAIDKVVRSKRVLASLFHVAFIYAHEVKGFDKILIEVNPRHVRFYERMLGFEVLESARLNRRVNAPAVLLGLDLNYVHERIAEMGRRAPDSEVEGTERSLYPYCFSAHEEAGIAGRLRVNAAS